jgi:diguanylate cyclase (GGDEF)-like protein
LAIVLWNLRVHKRFLSHIVDGITLCIIFLMLTFAARYAFGLSHVFGESPQNPMSLQSFLCLSIFTWLIVNRRAEYGAFSVLIGSQIGGKTVRFASPFALLLPFIFAFARVMAVRYHLASETAAAAAATAALSLFAFFLVLALGRRTNDLEDAIRELSLRDELTRLYNRRGFYVLAEQSLRLAHRNGETFFVLFIDVDDLKKTNDTFGHEAGSELLRDTASLIESTFRETDVIGRVGGDEFVVAGRVDVLSGENHVRRLEQAVIRGNSNLERIIPISFSIGYVESDGAQRDNLEQLLKKADMVMYEAKRARKRHRVDAVPTPA